MRLDILYHWSPADRYPSIARHGLISGSKASVASGELTYLCFGVDPASAWRISGAMSWMDEIDDWDLWMCRVGSADEVSVRGNFGPEIAEVNIRGHIPIDRLWWCGRRSDLGVAGR